MKIILPDNIKNRRISKIAMGVFYLFVCVISFLTLANYPGNAVVYIVFTISLNALFILGFIGNRIFFDTFIGIFFWLGYWLKFSMRVAFMGGEFREPVGNFNGTGADFDSALLITSCGIAALLAASIIRRRFFFSYVNIEKQPRFESIFRFYQRNRTLILIIFFVLFISIAFTNIVFGIYQRGSVPRTILPFGFSGIYAWLLLFGLASFSAVILDCEFRIEKSPYFVAIICFLECFFSSVSMLSRGMVINAGALIIGLIDNAKKRSFRLGLRYKIIILVVFGMLFLFSVFTVNHIRAEYFQTPSPKMFTSKFFVSKTFMPKSAVEFIRNIQVLFLDRWVGMEGIMAVSSYPHLGWDIWKKAWREKYSHSGTSLYDLTFITSQYLNLDLSRHHFIGIPGILAFFYYPGSLVFLFFSMLTLGLLGAGVEWLVYRLSGANIILCALMGQVVAYRYAHFGYVPRQSYLLFGSILLTVLIFYFLERTLLAMDRKRRNTLM